MNNPITISEEAMSAAHSEISRYMGSGLPGSKELDYGHFCQVAINSATAKLVEEIEHLQKQIGACSICGNCAWRSKAGADQVEECQFCKLTKELAEVKNQLPSTYYADTPLWQRIRFMVENWQVLSRLNIENEDELSSLTKERDELRKAFDQNFQQYNVALDSKHKQLLAMREALQKVIDNDRSIEGHLACIHVAMEALSSTTDFSKEFCKRSVLEKLYNVAKKLPHDSYNQTNLDFRLSIAEALTLARAELKE